VGGDKLGANDAVTVQSAGENGVGPEEEVDISVDLVAPEKPGRYVSHWRLLAPGGPKFGHRVWVLIQVVPKDEASPQVAESERMAGGTQEHAAMAADVAAPEAAEPTPAVHTAPSPAEAEPAPASPAAAQAADLIDFEGEVIDIEGVTSAAPAPGVAEVVAPVAESEPAGEEQEQALLVPVAVEVPPSAPVAAAAPAQTAPPAPTSPPSLVSVGGDTEATSVGNFALVDAPSAPTSVDGSAPASPRRNPSLADRVMAFDAAADMAAPPAEAPRLDGRMEKILQQLEAMGFKDGVRNLEVLQAHKMNIQAAVDDLISSAELDSQLADLKEMGFEDEQTNRRLLKKNKGDIKLTIRDIVLMDRQSASKAKEA
jgi:next-to-BRCA1 protein 1